MLKTPLALCALTLPFGGEIREPRLGDYFTIEVDHHGKETPEIDDMVEAMSQTPMKVFTDLIEREHASHGSLAKVLATKENRDELEMRAQECGVIVKFLWAVTLVPNERFTHEYKELPMTQARMIRQLGKFETRLTRRKREIEKHIKKYGEEQTLDPAKRAALSISNLPFPGIPASIRRY